MSVLFKLSLPAAFGNRRREGFERRIEALLPALTRLARGLIRNPDDAEDLVHDACVKALAAAGKDGPESDAALKAWMNRILVNTYRDQYRRRQRSPIAAHNYHATSDDNPNVYELVASSEQSPLERMQDHDSSSAIQHALSALPPEVRVVTVLFLVSELPYREIAEITESPMGTVMSRLSRGRRLLRESLSEFDPRAQSGSTQSQAGGEDS